MNTTFNLMAPLAVGDPENINSAESLAAWTQFAKYLATAKTLGAHGISTDVWWGLVEKNERQYTWTYYDRLVQYIESAGLKWVPILSFHKCGGNIGDTLNVDVPAWVFEKAARKLGTNNTTDVKYVSEHGYVSDDFVACWATPLVMDDYKAFFAEFHGHFALKAHLIAEINVSLGPAGELRYPSYSQAQGTDYPTRGAFQFYSVMARGSFVSYVLNKYKSIPAARAVWGELEHIEPPVDVEQFLAAGKHINSEYGRDLFDWANQCLIDHGRSMLLAAMEEFSSAGASFVGIDLGAKVPGIHWRMGHWEGDHIVFSDRLAELAAGLIRTRDWNSDDPGHGYQHYMSMLSDLQNVYANQRVVLHFTCLEMPDGENESLALQLTRWVAQEARRRGVPIKGENALNYTLFNPQSWILLRAAIGLGGFDRLYSGLTFLRVTDVVDNDVAREGFEETVKMAAEQAEESPRVQMVA